MQYIGTLRIFRVEPPAVNTPRTYVVTFVLESIEAEEGEILQRWPLENELKPHTSHGDDHLTTLLVGLGIPQDAINRALEELRQQGSTSIPSVVLSDAQLSQSGLQWTVGSKILSYLSALTR